MQALALATVSEKDPVVPLEIEEPPSPRPVFLLPEPVEIE